MSIVTTSKRAARAVAAVALSLALPMGPARADPPAAPPQPSPSPEARAKAKDLFYRCLELLDAGDHERALDCFLRSRALAPSKASAKNAAHCLQKLGRYDEALELYEELVTHFAAELDQKDRALLTPAMQVLRARVGSVVISANVNGAVLVDGRPRGQLPLSGPIRVLGGRHVVRVLKDGYGTFETTLNVAIGETVPIDAVLRPLAQAGQLRLEDPTNEGADVFVDRVRVGTVPWEGTLGPGEHLVWVAAAERGSAPTRAIVIQGQTATLRLRSRVLGPVASIAVEPFTAEVRLDGVSLGAGPWSGRLPVGEHEVVVSEPGYVARTVRFSEAEPGGPPAGVVVKLDIDPSHPRWPKRSIGRFFVDAFGGLAVGRGFGADAEDWCPARCSRGPGVLGAVAGARVGFRFPFGLSLEIAGGYMSLRESLARSKKETFTSEGEPRSVRYELEDDIQVRGPFVGGAVGYRVPIAGRFAVVSRVMVGVLIAGVADPITGRASTVDSAKVIVTGRDEPLRATPVIVEPEIDLEAGFGNLRIAAGLGLAAFLGAGPAYKGDLLKVNPKGCLDGDAGAVACAPASEIVSSEVAYRPFAVFVPTLSVGYAF